MELFSVPSSPSKFNTFQINAIRLLVANGVAWGVLPLAITNIVLSQTGFTPVYALCTAKATKSGGTIANRAALQAPFMLALISIFEKYLLNNAAISAADKLLLGIHTPSGIHTPVPPPSTLPEVSVQLTTPLVHKFIIRNAATGKFAKPAGVGFCEIWYKIGDPAPTTIDEATHKEFLIKSGSGITYNLADKSKTVHYFARWVSQKGVAGPWTDLFSAVIA